ncbi:MAG: hypothetical protein HOB73_01000 [Planctomycetaceae bacterium]|nr:hypothetical protein [Planctomycetaceae bacterium]
MARATALPFGRSCPSLVSSLDPNPITVLGICRSSKFLTHLTAAGQGQWGAS